MKLSKTEIINYRSIGNQCDVSFNLKSTVLVGKSNVGKSNILAALKTLFSSKKIPFTSKCSWSSKENICVKGYFDLDENNKASLAKIDERLADKEQLIVTKYYNSKRDVSFYPPLEIKKREEPSAGTIELFSSFRRRIRKQFRAWDLIEKDYLVEASNPIYIQFSELNSWVNKERRLATPKTLKGAKKDLSDFVEKITQLRTDFDKKLKDVYAKNIKTGLTYLIADVMSSIDKIKFVETVEEPIDTAKIIGAIPNLVFIDSTQDFDVDDKIYFEQIEEDSDHFMNRLLTISKIDFDALKNGTGREREDLIRKGNKQLQRDLTRFWNQEKLRIEFRDDFEEVELSEGEKTTSKRFLELDIIGAEGHRGSISQQGPGFVWFFWFVVNYLIDIGLDSDVLLVMDEPALHLHAAAQYDLLQRFNSTEDYIQIIYTTHSPFLIDKNYPQRILCVEKGLENEEKRGTIVNSKPYHSESGISWEPIRSSIGLPAGASLFVGGNNLVVEGISDHIILTAGIRALKNNNKAKSIDLNKVSINFGGDESNAIALTLFCHNETMSTKYLSDSDTIDKKKKKLMKGGFPEERIFSIGGIGSDDEKLIDIEDLFPHEFYHSCFLDSYARIPLDDEIVLPQSWEVVFDSLEADKKENWGKSKFYEKYFTNNLDTNFSKVLVAKEISEKLIAIDILEDKNVLRLLEKLIMKIWNSEPIWNK